MKFIEIRREKKCKREEEPNIPQIYGYGFGDAPAGKIALARFRFIMVLLLRFFDLKPK